MTKTEVVNISLENENLLCCLVEDRIISWERMLPIVESEYKRVVNCTGDHSLFEIALHLQRRKSIDLVALPL